MGDWPTERARHGGVDELPVPDVPGRLLLCGKHYVGPDPQTAMAESGADVVVCLCEAAELAGRYDGYVAWLRAADGDAALHRPVPDFHVPTPEALHALLDDIDARLEAGETVLLHCGAGIGRTGTVAAAVLLRHGVALDDALDVVRTSRPMAGPEVGAQRDALEALARAPRR